VTERETLLAEIAERQARLAEIDAEPDWQAWKPLVREIISMYHTTRLADADVAAHILGKPSVRALIAALPKAPPMGSSCPSCHGLNLSCPEGCGRDENGELDGSTLTPPMGECQPRWPSEAELREMADVSSQSKYSPYAVALEMANRIRAYQTGDEA